MDLRRKTTQVVMRFTSEVELGTETYSIGLDTASARLVTQVETGQPAGKVDRRLESFFRPGSIEHGALHYERIRDIQPILKIDTYLSTRQDLKLLGPGSVEVRYIEPKQPIDPYFFLSKGVVRLLDKA